MVGRHEHQNNSGKYAELDESRLYEQKRHNSNGERSREKLTYLTVCTNICHFTVESSGDKIDDANPEKSLGSSET